MNRPLLETVLNQIKQGLLAGGAIGDLKIAALFALGSQLEAIFYYLGHELASKFDGKPASKPEEILTQLQEIGKRYHLGTIAPLQMTPQQITFTLADGYSTRFIRTDQLRTQNTFCSFEAGLFAGLVEKITKNPAFAQEISCKCQGKPVCEFMVMFA